MPRTVSSEAGSSNSGLTTAAPASSPLGRTTREVRSKEDGWEGNAVVARLSDTDQNLPEEAVVFLDDIFLRLGARHWEGDPKALVDMRLKHTAMEVKKIMYAREHQLENSREMWEAFMAWGFEKDFHFTPTPPEGSNKHTASAWVHFEQDLRERWDQLTASFPPAQFTSRIAVPNPVVVPGGRFNESYYWDSYWIIEGLLRSDRVELARGIVENFATLIHAYGFVPNGTRIYYTNRSQPPMLAEMVLAILAAENPSIYEGITEGTQVQRIARESV